MNANTRSGRSVDLLATRSHALRRALMVDLRLNGDRFAGTLVSCGLCLILAAVLSDAFADLLLLWAVLAWYRYGRADTVERDELRAGLGMSRADRTRGRVALIALETLVILLTTGVATLIAGALGDGSDLTGSAASVAIPPWFAVVLEATIATLSSAAMLLLTGIWVGGDCLTRRPGRSMAVLSVLVYLLAVLLGAFVFSLPLMVLSRIDAPVILSSLMAPLGLLVVVVLLALLLRARMHAWTRQLDSGFRQRFEPLA